MIVGEIYNPEFCKIDKFKSNKKYLEPQVKHPGVNEFLIKRNFLWVEKQFFKS